MKKIYFLLFFIPTLLMQGQTQSGYISFGKPWFPDKDKNLNNFSVGINYQNRFSKSFSYGVNVGYAQSDNFPSFYKNKKDLDRFILSQNAYENDFPFYRNWDNIKIYQLGGKIGYSFVNNKRFLLSFNAVLGFAFSVSELYNIKSFTHDYVTGEIIKYTGETIKEKMNNFYRSFGIQFQYTFHKNYFIGINPSFFYLFDNEHTETIPVYPSYYNLEILIGKSF